MTIGEAIETLERNIPLMSFDQMPAHSKAEKLGIEALKWIEAHGKVPGWHKIIILPGETEE